MAMTITTSETGEGKWTSPRRLFLTQDGRVVGEHDANAAFLLVGEGGQLDYAEAERYGLTAQVEPPSPVLPELDTAVDLSVEPIVEPLPAQAPAVETEEPVKTQAVRRAKK